MTAAPFHDIAARARAAALKGQRLHLEVEHARALAQHPEVQALLGRLIAEETARLCRADQSLNDPLGSGSPPLASPSPIPPAPPLPVPSGWDPSTSIGGPIGSDTVSAGMMPGLVQDAESSRTLALAQDLIRQSRHNRRSQRTLPATPAPPKRKNRPRLVSLPS